MAHLFSGKVQLTGYPAEGFGEVTLVVLGLDDSDLEWPDWFDLEEVEAECPSDDDLHHKGRLSDTGTTADDHGGAAGDPSITDQVIRIVGWIEVHEFFDGDDRGLVVIGLAGGEVVLP